MEGGGVQGGVRGGGLLGGGQELDGGQELGGRRRARGGDGRGHRGVHDEQKDDELKNSKCDNAASIGKINHQTYGLVWD